MEAVHLVAKISRPRPTGVLPRKRLFRMLDRATRRPVVWISAPAASGKTTLVASYVDARRLPCLWYQIDERDADPASFFYYLGLAARRANPRRRIPLPLFTPEYARGLSIFTRRFFEEVFATLRSSRRAAARAPFLVVFDTYGEVPAESPFHGILADGLSAIPDGLRAIVVSRSQPLEAFARFAAAGRISQLGWEELRFTLAESRALARRRSPSRAGGTAITRLHEKADGWIGGLVILLESARRRAPDDPVTDVLAPAELDDYFTSEVVARTDAATRNFLLRTAFLPKMTASMAARLTGARHAGAVLARLSRRNFFIDTHPAAEEEFQYHPLFRDFLRSRARASLTPAQMSRLLRRAGQLLEGSGHVDAAAGLLIEARAWDALGPLIRRHASSMVSLGRLSVLDQWLASVPGAVLAGEPQLLHWLGVCRLSQSPPEAGRLFADAFTRFTETRDVEGACLAWCGIVEAVFAEGREFAALDGWIAALEDVLGGGQPPPLPDLEARVAAAVLNALLYRQPENPALRHWEARARDALRSVRDAGVKTALANSLTLCHLWRGEFTKVAALRHDLGDLRDVAASDSSAIVGRTFEAMYWWHNARFADSLAALREALELAAKTGLYVWNIYIYPHAVHALLSQEDLGTAASYLEKMARELNPSHRMDASHYHWLTAWRALLTHDVQTALEHAQTSFDLVCAAGTPWAISVNHLTLAEILFESGDREAAAAHLIAGTEIARRIRSRCLEYKALLLSSYFALERGKRDEGLASLRAALGLGRTEGYLNTFNWRAGVMSRLCTEALAAALEPEYVRRLVRARHLAPEPAGRLGEVLETWPYPLRIHTLGRFALVADEGPVHFSGKVQRKPLLMLKVLVALGGTDVPEARISEVLWPEAEGDLAGKSFETTLTRLRRLIAGIAGTERLLQLSEGCVTLDRRYCWADVWALEESLVRAEQAWRRHETRARDRDAAPGAGAEAIRATERALALLTGEFLPAEGDQAWARSLRDQLRRRAVRLVARSGRHWEQAAEWEKARECYLRGLEIDDAAEELYQGLMLCSGELGQRAEAVKAYERCRRALAASLGIEPSARTTDLYARLCR